MIVCFHLNWWVMLRKLSEWQKPMQPLLLKAKIVLFLETTVPPGPFRIQTLDSSIQGQLDVTIREDNGEERKFTISTATLPYLTRPGQIRYKLVGVKHVMQITD